MDADYILETRNLVKEFKGFVAVSDVNLRVRRGRIHALIGPNGAGKTTVFNLLTKFLVPTRGVIHFKGEAELLGNLPAVIDQDRKCRAASARIVSGSWSGLRRHRSTCIRPTCAPASTRGQSSSGWAKAPSRPSTRRASHR